MRIAGVTRSVKPAGGRPWGSLDGPESGELLAEIDIDGLWQAATDQERRVLVEELVEEVAVLPDHLEVVVAGAPRLNVLYREVGLKESQIGGVGGGT